MGERQIAGHRLYSRVMREKKKRVRKHQKNKQFTNPKKRKVLFVNIRKGYFFLKNLHGFIERGTLLLFLRLMAI